MIRWKIFLVALAASIGANIAVAAPPISGNVAAPSGNTPLTVPASIAGSGSWISPCVAAAQYRAFDVFAAVAAAATLQVQRYADASTCIQPVGPAIPGTALALTNSGNCPASTYCGDVGANDGLPFMALKITVTDTSASTNAITSVTLIQGAE